MWMLSCSCSHYDSSDGIKSKTLSVTEEFASLYETRSPLSVLTEKSCRNDISQPGASPHMGLSFVPLDVACPLCLALL